MISAISCIYQYPHLLGSLPLLFPATITIPHKTPHLNPVSSSSILPLSGKPNPPSSSTNTSNYIPTHFLNYIPYPVFSTNSNMCNFSLVSPLNRPFYVTMTCERSLFLLVSSHSFKIPFRDIIKTSSLHKPPHKPRTTSTSPH